jgi:hypothetical protein
MAMLGAASHGQGCALTAIGEAVLVGDEGKQAAPNAA